MTAKQQKIMQKSTAQTVALKPEAKSLKKYYYLMGIIVFFLFANTLGNGYNMDDSMVTINHKLTSQGFGAIKEIFTSPYYDDGVYAYGYRPMVHLSFALEHELFGEKPGSGHFINVLLFALSVVLFFKLLVKWIGEKNALFAGIATLLFAVHPIHTEVVASLKNRDEILTFLFAIWAGLSAHKFLERDKWISLIGAGLLFSLAMLSKKSSYPMAIVFPIAVLLTQDVSIKKIALIAIVFIVPAALIGSDLQLERGIIMTFLPLVLIGFIYFIKSSFPSEDKQINVQTVLSNWMIPALLSIAIIAFAIYSHMFWIVCLTIPFLVWLFKSNFKIGIIISTLILIAIDGLLIEDRNLRILALMSAFGYFIFGVIQQKERDYKIWLPFLSVVTFYFLFKDLTLSTVVITLSVLLFFIIMYKKPWIGLILIVATMVFGFINSDKLTFSPLIACIFAILCIFEKKYKSFSFSAMIPILAFSWITMSLSYYELKSHESVAMNVIEESINQPSQVPATASKNFLKEGRQLEYVENTLVAPHSPSEKVATGFLTLGEYLRLHIYPKELSFYYGFSKVKTVDFRHPLVIVSVLAHLLLIVLAVWQIRKRPLISIGIVWYFLGIVLFSNWIELVAGMVGERLAFTASAGFAIFITGLLYWIKPTFSLKNPGIVGAVLGVVLLLFVGRTLVRNTDWKDTLTLMTHDIQHLQNSAQANNLYARTLMNNSVNDKSLTSVQRLEIQKTAIKHYEIAVQTAPDFFNVYIDLARATMYTKDYEKGIAALGKAKKIDPKNAVTHYTLLEITELSGDFKTYLKSAEELFKIDQTDYTYGVVARGHFLLKDYKSSREILLEGLQKFPDSELLNKNLKIVNGVL